MPKRILIFRNSCSHFTECIQIRLKTFQIKFIFTADSWLNFYAPHGAVRGSVSGQFSPDIYPRSPGLRSGLELKLWLR